MRKLVFVVLDQISLTQPSFKSKTPFLVKIIPFGLLQRYEKDKMRPFVNDSSMVMVETFDPSRRRFLQIGAVATGLVMVNPSSVLASIRTPKMKELAFRNLHTGERLRVTYWKDGRHDRTAMGKINHVLRDFRTNETFPMSANLIDLLHDMQMKLRTDSVIEIISGYRSPKTNAMLASQSDGVAKQSFHTKGIATDIRMEGVSLRQIQATALFMRRGGVGYYPASDFVHVDVGPVRRWG